MPQKRNPMLCEAILALARLIRTQAVTAVDAMHHEHERDWSSFQMEWAYLPEICVMTHGALELTTRVISGLRVYPENMRRNLNVTGGSLLAERVMLALGEHIGRQSAHDVIYEAAMHSFEQHIAFATVLKADARVTDYLDVATLDTLLDPVEYLGLSAQFVDRVVQSLDFDGTWS